MAEYCKYLFVGIKVAISYRDFEIDVIVNDDFLKGHYIRLPFRYSKKATLSTVNMTFLLLAINFRQLPVFPYNIRD